MEDFSASFSFFLFEAEEQAQKGAAVEGDERIEIAMRAVQRFVGDEQQKEQNKPAAEAP